MDDQGRFRQAAVAAGIPEGEIDRFLEHLRLPVRLSGGSGGVPAGQFGGSPRLPVGEPWPAGPAGPLPFVFSVDCAALPGAGGLGLAAGGALLFFLDHENDHLAAATGEQGYARVLHVPAGTATTAVEPPAAGLTGERYDAVASLVAELPPWFPADGEDDAEEEDEDDLSPFQQGMLRDLQDDLPHLDELRALADDLWPPDGGAGSASIGGYADDEVIGSIAEQVLAGRERAGEIVVPVANWYSHVEREKHRLTSEWMSLARFPVADEFYSASFVIRRDDLAAGRLDRALSVTWFSE